jgi:serine/threonine protein kinase
MECLEGETLVARLQRGALPIADALRYAIEMASAPDKAHRAGIVHRDLNPANIILTKEGAKLVDFGLAALRLPSAHGAVTGLTTVLPERGLTEKGTILGTVQYLAPEQVEGQTTDARTDIFAFGAVLSEWSAFCPRPTRPTWPHRAYLPHPPDRSGREASPDSFRRSDRPRSLPASGPLLSASRASSADLEISDR